MIQTRRMLRPSLVTTVGKAFLAVDEVQPVAVLLSPSGEVLDKVSWRDEIEPVTERKGWPRRRLISWGNDVTILDEGCESWAHVSAESNKRLQLHPAVAISDLIAPSDSTASQTRISTNITFDRGEANWQATSQLDDLWWTSKIVIDLREDRCRRRWQFNEFGSITSGTLLDDNAPTMAFCIRRAHKRPWQFRPEYSLVLTSRSADEVELLSIREIDITELCWRQSYDYLRTARLMSDYISYSYAEYLSAHRAGATMVDIRIRSLDSLPVIELRFMLPQLPGTVFRRLDVPFDEVGAFGSGLRDLGIFLEEDLQADVPAKISRISPTDTQIAV